MANFGRIVLVSFFVLAATLAAFPQDFPPKLIQAEPLAVQKLTSNDIAERVSLLNLLVFHVPQSCTLELGLRHKLSREDYVFVVDKILEKDLRTLNEKLKPESWTLLSHLITKFEMKKVAGAVAAYVDDVDWRVQAAVIQTILHLKATEFDGEVAMLLNAVHPYVRQAALEALIVFKSRKATPALISKLWDKNPSARYWALDKLAVIGAVDAAGIIAGRLREEQDDDIKYWTLDALARLNSKDQAWAVWQFRQENTNKRLDGFAVAILVQFEQKTALPLVVENMKAVAGGGQEFHILEFIRKLMPKFLIPELIRLYNTKASFLPDPDGEKRFRHDVLQLLFQYRSPAAIPIYRENFPGGQPWDPNGYVAQVLLDMDAREAVDDILAEFARLANPAFPGSDNDLRAGPLAIILAKFGEKRTWKPLISYLQNSKYFDRERIFIELNKHIDPKLWKDAQRATPVTRKVTSVRNAIDIISLQSKIPITIVDIPELGACPTEGMNIIESRACAYVNPAISVSQTLEMFIQSFNNRQRGEYTFVFDNGTIKILKTKDAVEFWKTNILSKLR